MYVYIYRVWTEMSQSLLRHIQPTAHAHMQSTRHTCLHTKVFMYSELSNTLSWCRWSKHGIWWKNGVTSGQCGTMIRNPQPYWARHALCFQSDAIPRQRAGMCADFELWASPDHAPPDHILVSENTDCNVRSYLYLSAYLAAGVRRVTSRWAVLFLGVTTCWSTHDRHTGNPGLN